MISRKFHCSIYFTSNFIKFIFVTLTTKWLSVSTLPHLGTSVIQYHLYASALFISPKSMKYSLLKYKRCIDIPIHNHKN